MNEKAGPFDDLLCSHSRARQPRALLFLVLQLIILVPGIYWMCFHNLGIHSFWLPDELIHVSVVQEMQESGDWWHPQLRGEPYFNKPPFKMWLSALPLWGFGETKFAYRFLDGLATAGTVLLTFFFARCLFASGAIALLSAYILLGCKTLILDHITRMAVQDAMLVLLCTAAFVSAWFFLKNVSHEQNRRRVLFWALLGGLSVGLAIMTKSLGGALPLFVLGLYLPLSGKLACVLKNGLWPLICVLILSLGIPALYFVPHLLETSWAAQVIFGHELTHRVLTGYHNADKPALYWNTLIYKQSAVPPILLFAGVLFSLFHWLKNKDERFSYLFCWSVGVVLVYQIPNSKLAHYLAPAFPAMSILAAVVICCALQLLCFKQSYWRKAGFRGAAAAAAAVVLLVWGGSEVVLNIRSVAAQVAAPEKPILLDRVVSSIKGSLAERSSGDEARAAKVLHYKGADFGFYELPYLRLLGRNYRRIDKNASPPLERVLAEKPSFIITSPALVPELITQHEISAYRYIPPPPELVPKPPFSVRENWLVALSFLEGSKLAEFTPTKRLVNFGGAQLEALYGFGGRSQLGKLQVRSSTGPKSAFVVKGDHALRRFGSSVLLNFAAHVGEEKREVKVGVFINAEKIAVLQPQRNRIDTYGFTIPPETLHPGKNVMTLLAEYREPGGETWPKLVLNWMSLRLNQGAVR